MRQNAMRLAALLFLASLAGMGLSQSWPARFDYAGYDDTAAAVTVDHRGNVYVCGTVQTGTSGLDMYVRSYAADGSLRWGARWDDASNGNDTATAIGVDWNGGVYVAGITDAGLSGSHLVVVKYDSAGHPVWPLSEDHSASGYNFNNGGIVLTAGDDAGPVSMAVANVAGDQPTFAVCCYGHSRSAGHVTWRTVVFNAAVSLDGHKRILIRPGWPVDEFDGTVAGPNGIAIGSDNTPYVTGGVETTSGTEAYTTVKYAATGTLNTGGPGALERHLRRFWQIQRGPGDRFGSERQRLRYRRHLERNR